jgi:hypothetical protein
LFAVGNGLFKGRFTLSDKPHGDRASIELFIPAVGEIIKEQKVHSPEIGCDGTDARFARVAAITIQRRS